MINLSQLSILLVKKLTIYLQVPHLIKVINLILHYKNLDELYCFLYTINMHSREHISSLTHFIGFLFSIAGLVLLIIFGTLYGSASHIVGFSVFGTGLILLYLASAIYHIIHVENPTKKLFQKIDHAMIYVLIACTYTPLLLVLPHRAWGWSLFGIIWGLALLGVALKLFKKKVTKVFSSLLYLIMGWLIVIAFPILNSVLSSEAIFWLALGGIFYTIGIIFFALEKKFPRTGWIGMHEIFHLFVMAGSFSHFWFMFKFVLYI